MRIWSFGLGRKAAASRRTPKMPNECLFEKLGSKIPFFNRLAEGVVDIASFDGYLASM
jgi:hypothetical protein